LKNNDNKNIYNTKIIMVIVGIIILFLLSMGLWQKKTEKKVTIPNGLGVNIHFAGKQVDIDMISDAGFNMVRTDLFWSAIETKKGIYDYTSYGYDELTNELTKERLRPYYVLDYSNKLYEKNGGAIVTKQGREAFNRFVDNATQRYKNKGIIWEVWNEPNTDSWVPQPNINEYFLLLKQTSNTIKRNDPSAMVVGPALAGITDESLTWLEELFKKGALNYVDAISVHPYRGSNPETVTKDYQTLKTLIKKYTSKHIPIISGEWGYSTANGWYGNNLDEEQQAEALVRMFLINKVNKIPISIWYDWKDEGNNPDNHYDNFGLRKENIEVPKMAYQAMNTFSYMLSGYQLKNRMNTGSAQDYILRFVNQKKETLFVMWTTREKHQITLPIKKGKGHVFSMLGNEMDYFNSNDSQNPLIEISDKPIYLEID